MLLRSAAAKLKRETELKQENDQRSDQATKIPECDDHDEKPSKNEDVNNGVDNRSNKQTVMEAYYPVVSRKKEHQIDPRYHSQCDIITNQPPRSQKRKQNDEPQNTEEEPNDAKKQRTLLLGDKNATTMKQSTIVSWFTFYVPRPEPPFKMPAACMYRIMEYSDPRVCHILATSLRELHDMMTYDLVVRAAMLGGANCSLPFKLRIQYMLAGILQGSMIIPSPQRLLSLLNGEYCEMGLCCDERENIGVPLLYESDEPSILGVPGSLECGLFVCSNCARCASIPSKFVKSEKYRAILGKGFNSHGRRMFWRKPYLTADGERIGPARTMTDADVAVLGSNIKEEVVGDHESVAKRQIKEAYYESTSLQKYTTTAGTNYRKKVRLDHVRNQFECIIIRTSGQKIWIEVAIERNADGSFRWHAIRSWSPQSREEECVCAWGGDRDHFSHLLVKWVREAAAYFDDHYRKIAGVGIHDVSFLENESTPVERYWHNKWKLALEKDKNFMIKATMNLSVMPYHLERNTFANLAEHILGKNFRTILVLEALPKERMTTSDGHEFDEQLSTLWYEANGRYSWCWYNDFDDRCEYVYDGMMAKYGKDDDDESDDEST